MPTAFLLWGGDGWAAGPRTFWLGPPWGPLWVGLIVGGIWLIFRGGPGAGYPLGGAGGCSEVERVAEVLAERYARGEISTDESRERLAHLRGSGA
jgi:putative membrane protein